MALRTLEEARELEVPAIGIAGGEPFMNPDLLRKLITQAASFGMTTILVTNAYWAASRDEAMSRLSALREWGLDRIQLSLDDQHQEVIPIENVANAARAALALEYDDVKLLGTSVGNTRTFASQLFYVQELLDIPLERIDLIDRPRTSHTYFEDEEQMRYEFSELESAESLELPVRKPGDCLSEMMLDVNGDIYPCCNNFVGRIGNMHVDTFSDMIERLPSNEHFRILKKDGPFELARYLDETEGTDFSRKKYSNWCELCSRLFQEDLFRDLLTCSRPTTKRRN